MIAESASRRSPCALGPGLALGLALILGPGTARAASPAALHAAPARGAPSTASSVPAQARLRVAFVDTARILRDSALARAASNKLKQDFEPRRRKLARLSQRIAALRARLSDAGSTLSDDQRLAAQQQLAELDRRFRDGQQAFAEDLNAQRNADVTRILDEANAVVDRVARDKGCEIVFQGAVYVNPRIDITPEVIRALDASQTSPGSRRPAP